MSKDNSELPKSLKPALPGDSSAESKAVNKTSELNDKLVRETSPIPTKPPMEAKLAKQDERSAGSSSSDAKASQKESSSSGEKSSSTQPADKATDTSKGQPAEKPSRSIEQNTQQSESKGDRNTGGTGKQAEHIPTTQPEAKAKESAGGGAGGGDSQARGGGDNQGGGRGRGGGSGGDVDTSTKEKSSAVVAPDVKSDASPGKVSDPKGGGDASRSADVKIPEAKAGDVKGSERAPDVQKTSEGKVSDTARDGSSPVPRDSGRQDAQQRSEAKAPESGVPKETGGRQAEQSVKTADIPQDRAARQIEKDPIAGGKPADAQAGKLVDQKIDAILLDSKQAGQGRGQEKVDPKDARGDAGQKVPDGRLDAGQKVPDARGDAGSRMGGGGDIRVGGTGADARGDAGKRPEDARAGDRPGIIGGDKGVAAGRLDVHITPDAVKLHLPEKGGQEINLADKGTQRTMNEAFNLFDKNELKQIATNFKQQVDLWTELTSKQFNGLKDTIANVLDAPKAAAMKELSSWAQDLTKRPEPPADVRQELGHAVKMQLLDNLKRNDDIDRRHADMKERGTNLLDEFKQIRTELQGRCEEAIRIARSFFTSPIERPPVVHIAETSSRKLTEAEIDELLNVRLREFTPPKSKEQEPEKDTDVSDKADQQAATQQAMRQASHTVKKGETVAMIAAKYCGTEECAVLVAEMNRGVISATYDQGNLVFHAPEGAVLNLPYDRDIREFKERVLGLAGNTPDSNQA